MSRAALRGRLLGGLLLLSLTGCRGGRPRPGASSRQDEGTRLGASARGPLASSSPADTEPAPPIPVREGSTLVRSATNRALYLADEDHAVVRAIPLPIDVANAAQSLTVPGPPAEVLALADRILVTIRDPGLLLVLRVADDGALSEAARIPIPADAWGIAVSPDQKLALVTSAWTHQVSAVDLRRLTKLWSIDVPREPRGVVVSNDGRAAYVTHLVGTEVTKVDLAADVPTARSITLPASALRTPPGVTLGASLGYAAVLSPNGRRLFAPRHALGAVGEGAWFGAATVDVLMTASDSPLAPPRHTREIGRHVPHLEGDDESPSPILAVSDPEVVGRFPLSAINSFVQPRAAAYRRSTNTLLIAGEGNDTLVELDALAIDPSAQALRAYRIGLPHDTGVAVAGGAPSGIALSADETTAYVFCRANYDLAIVLLESYGADTPYEAGPIPVLHLADDTLSKAAAHGRRLFYNATDQAMSGGLACAGCHPEGRDDGFVWHEVVGPMTNAAIFVGNAKVVTPGQARQTPMLAGRVASEGPYGWHGQNPDLEARAKEGFHLHRWFAGFDIEEEQTRRALHLKAFLRLGLVPPPRPTRDLTPLEERGKELFHGDAVGCTACHAPESEFTDRIPHRLRAGRFPAGFDEDPTPFRTPALLFVGGTAPYFHDGSARTLEELIDQNKDRMGRTSQLSPKDRAALAAYLKTL